MNREHQIIPSAFQLLIGLGLAVSSVFLEAACGAEPSHPNALMI